MNLLDEAHLEKRFELGRTRPLSVIFEKSPNITEPYPVSDHILVWHAAQDASILPLIEESVLRAYVHVTDWFGYEKDVPLGLWMAPAPIDLQYMVCHPCDDGFFCAPGVRNGNRIILFVSPLSCPKNAGKDHLAGCLAHEIVHHVVRDISYATLYTMRRQLQQDVPMWLEEGLCQLIQSEVNPSLQQSFSERIAGITGWYRLEELWNDLSSCSDPAKGYLQAYKETRAFVDAHGKPEITRLLYLNRTRRVNWKDFPHAYVSPANPEDVN